MLYAASTRTTSRALVPLKPMNPVRPGTAPIKPRVSSLFSFTDATSNAGGSGDWPNTPSQECQGAHGLLLFVPADNGPPGFRFDHSIVGRDLKHRGGRLAANDVLQCIGGRAHARVGALVHHRYLQLRRIPAFGYGLEGQLIANLARGNRDRGACALSGNAFDRPRAEVLCNGFDLRGTGLTNLRRTLSPALPAGRIHHEGPRLHDGPAAVADTHTHAAAAAGL